MKGYYLQGNFIYFIHIIAFHGTKAEMKCGSQLQLSKALNDLPPGAILSETHTEIHCPPRKIIKMLLHVLGKLFLNVCTVLFSSYLFCQSGPYCFYYFTMFTGI